MDSVQVLVGAAHSYVYILLLASGAWIDVKAIRLVSAARNRYGILIAAGVSIYE